MISKEYDMGKYVHPDNTMVYNYLSMQKCNGSLTKLPLKLKHAWIITENIECDDLLK